MLLILKFKLKIHFLKALHFSFAAHRLESAALVMEAKAKIPPQVCQLFCLRRGRGFIVRKLKGGSLVSCPSFLDCSACPFSGIVTAKNRSVNLQF